MSYSLTAEAVRQFRQIGSDTARLWGQVQAQKYLRELQSGFLRIDNDPSRGRAYRLPDSRLDLRLRRTGRHYVVYGVKEDHVTILAILHERMDLPERIAELLRVSAADLVALRQSDRPKP